MSKEFKTDVIENSEDHLYYFTVEVLLGQAGIRSLPIEIDKYSYISLNDQIKRRQRLLVFKTSSGDARVINLRNCLGAHVSKEKKPSTIYLPKSAENKDLVLN